VHAFRDTFRVNLVHVDAEERNSRFWRAVDDPRRSATSSARSSGRSSSKRPRSSRAWMARAGHLYPDVIESGNKHARRSRAITNSSRSRRRALRPHRALKALFRRGPGGRHRAGLPDEIVTGSRPGPRLSRSASSVTSARQARQASAGPTRSCARRSPSGTPIASLAVLRGAARHQVASTAHGDERTYENPIIIRAVSFSRCMTADWPPSDELLARMSNRIINEVDGHQPRRVRHHEQASALIECGVGRCTVASHSTDDAKDRIGSTREDRRDRTARWCSC